jgi:hypothetical protein
LHGSQEFERCIGRRLSPRSAPRFPVFRWTAATTRCIGNSLFIRLSPTSGEPRETHRIMLVLASDLNAVNHYYESHASIVGSWNQLSRAPAKISEKDFNMSKASSKPPGFEAFDQTMRKLIAVPKTALTEVERRFQAMKRKKRAKRKP